jgi:hypothetical protein
MEIKMNPKDYTAADLAGWAKQSRTYEPATQAERNTIDGILENLLHDAGIVAHIQKERRMPIQFEGLLKLLKYTRQPGGANVSREHALNGATRYFLEQMDAKGFGVSQYYVGEIGVLFSYQGSQRLMLNW